jgi:hypothetical protein
MNPFSETYRLYSDEELIELLTNKSSYQQLAIEAAEAELERRKLTVGQIHLIQEELSERNEERAMQNAKQLKPVLTVRSNIEKFVAELDPNDQITPSKAISYISISLIVILLYHFFMEQSIFLSNIRHFSLNDWYYIMWAVPYVYLPVAIVLFWKKYRWGWLLLHIWAVYNLLTVLFFYIMEYRFGFAGNFAYSSYASTGMLSYITSILTYGGLLVYLNRNEIKNIYKIDRNSKQLVVLYSILIAFAYLIVSFF